MTLDKLNEFLRKEWAAFVAEAIRPRVETPVPVQREADLIERASEGAAVRQFLESRQVMDFMARAEANMTHAMLALPLEDDAGRRNLAVAIQSHRQLLRYLGELAAGGRSAERELERLSKGPRPYF